MSKALLLGTLCLLAGCGGSSVTADQACTDLATARCTKRNQCAPGTLSKIYGDLATCVAREKLGCMNAVVAPGNGNNPANAETCAGAYPALSCSDFFSGNPPAICVYTGSVQAGGTCAFNGQCATTYCVGSTDLSCGTCGMPTSSCANNGVCARGQVCINDTCVALGAMGAACDRNNPCGLDLSCVGSTMTTMGTCQPAVNTAGSMCTPSQQTGPGCDSQQALACNTMGKICETIKYVGDGQACGLLADGSTAICAASGLCILPSATAKMGTCKAAAADGAACDTAAGPDCLPPARCVTGGTGTAGTCQVSDATRC